MADLAVTDKNFEDEVLNEEGVVLVDFWAAWCMPCQMLGPIIEELAEEMGDKVKVRKLNVDENKQTAGKYQVMSIPTVMIFKDGKAEKTLVGVQPKPAYETAIKEVLGEE
jgi:thioredoxin 1